MNSFSLIFARGKHFVVAFERSSGLPKCGISRKQFVIQHRMLSFVCHRLVVPSKHANYSAHTFVSLIHSTHQDYQMILCDTDMGNQVNKYLLLSTRDRVWMENFFIFFRFLFFFFYLQTQNIALNFIRSENADLN